MLVNASCSVLFIYCLKRSTVDVLESIIGHRPKILKILCHMPSLGPKIRVRHCYLIWWLVSWSHHQSNKILQVVNVESWANVRDVFPVHIFDGELETLWKEQFGVLPCLVPCLREIDEEVLDWWFKCHIEPFADELVFRYFFLQKTDKKTVEKIDQRSIPFFRSSPPSQR